MYTSSLPLYPSLYKYSKNVNFVPTAGENYSDIFTFLNSANPIGQFNVTDNYNNPNLSGIAGDISLPNKNDFENVIKLNEPTTVSQANAYILASVGIGMLFSLIFKT